MKKSIIPLLLLALLVLCLAGCGGSKAEARPAPDGDGPTAGAVDQDGGSGTSPAPLITGEDGTLSWTFDPATGALTISGEGYLSYVARRDDGSGLADFYHLSLQDLADYKDQIKSIEVKEGIFALAGHAFHEFPALESVSLPQSMTVIEGTGNFERCPLLEHVDLPEQAETIFDDMFHSCYSLKQIVLPEGIPEISSSAFESCVSLKSVYIPASVTRIAPWAFDCCYSLEIVNYGGTREQFEEIFICDNNDPIFDAEICFNAPREAPLPQALTEIPKSGQFDSFSWTFDEASGVFTVNGDGPFRSVYAIRPMAACLNRIKSVVLGDDITEIGGCAFANMPQLEAVSLPEGLTGIYGEAFAECNALKSIIIPKGTEGIGPYTFANCASLRDVVLPEMFIISNYAFYKCPSLESIVLPANIGIGTGAFYGCPALENVIFSQGIVEIMPAAFSQCTALRHIVIPDSVDSISFGTFYGCSSLQSVTFSSGLLEIKNDAFCDCPALTDVVYNGTQEQWYAVAVDEGNDDLLNARFHFGT